LTKGERQDYTGGANMNTEIKGIIISALIAFAVVLLISKIPFLKKFAGI